MIVRATLRDGTQVISVFSKLTKLRNYAAAVFSGQKPFNGWTTSSETHPNGERIPMRQRVLINGHDIIKLEAVREVPSTTEGGTPTYEAITLPPKGSRGYFTFAEEGAPELAIPGILYPKYRDGNMREYVILRAGTPAEGETEATPDVRFFVDGLGERPRPGAARPSRPWEGSNADAGADLDEDEDDTSSRY